MGATDLCRKTLRDREIPCRVHLFQSSTAFLPACNCSTSIPTRAPISWTTGVHAWKTSAHASGFGW